MPSLHAMNINRPLPHTAVPEDRSLPQANVQSPAPLMTPGRETSTGDEALGGLCGLRRRRPPRDVEAGAGNTETSVGVASAVSPLRRNAAQRLFGTSTHNPITTGMTLPTYQWVNNISSGGQPGSVPLLPKFPPLDDERHAFQVPEMHDARMETARKLLQSAHRFEAWLAAPAATEAEGAGTPPSLGQTVVTALGHGLGVAHAAARGLGLAVRETPRLSEMASGAPSQDERVDLQLTVQRTLIAAAGAQYGARSIELEVDKAVKCLAASTGDLTAALNDHAARFKDAARAFHALPPHADAEQRRTAAATLQRLEVERPNLPTEISLLYESALGEFAGAIAAQAHAERSHRQAEEQLAAIRTDRMVQLVDGIEDPRLKGSLQAISAALNSRAATADLLPSDGALEKIYMAGCAAFHDDHEVAGRALQSLRALDCRNLASAVSNPEGAAEESLLAARLAREIAVLPRGTEMLSSIIALPGQIAPGADSGRPAQEAAARRRNALRVLFVADDALQGDGLSQAARQHLAGARTAASRLLHDDAAQPSSLAPDLRKAYNAVRNEFTHVGAGSNLEQADEYLKGLTTDMLNSASRQEGLIGSLARSLPIGGATALNPSAVKSATTPLAQAGLIQDTPQAVDAIRPRIDALRGGEQATVAEKALKALAAALDAAVLARAPEALIGVSAPELSLPPAFGLDPAALENHPPLQQLWQQLDAGALKPAEVAHRLARLAAEGLSAPEDKPLRDEVVAYRKALDKAVGSAIWNRSRIDDKHQLLDGMIAVARLMTLRDRFKFTGGNAVGVDTSKIQFSMKPPKPQAIGSVTMRGGIAGKYQHDLVVEFGMTTQAYYLTVGTQSTVGGKVAAGAGFSLKHGSGVFAEGARMIDGGLSASMESQSQQGLLARVPRDKRTEEANQQEFEELLRQAILWEDHGHSGPADAILSNVDAASLNLLGQYSRNSTRGELTVGLGPQFGFSRPGKTPAAESGHSAASPTKKPAATQVGQVRGGPQLRTQGEVRRTLAEEATGHYKYQEARLGRRKLWQVSTVANLSVRVKDFGNGRGMNVGDVASVARSADWLDGAEITRRLVTMDGATAPQRSRRVTEYLNLEAFRAAADAERARWINHGNTYTKFPAGFEHKQPSSEQDFEQFFHDAAERDNQFKQYVTVDCLQDSAAAIVDDLDGNVQQAVRMGRTERAATEGAKLEQFLADESTWQPRRLVINSLFNTANQPGASVAGLDLRVSDNSEGAHNESLFPRG